MSAPFAVAHRMPRTSDAVHAWLAAGVARFECDVQLGHDGALAVSHYLPFLRVDGWFQHDGIRFRWRDGRNGRRDLTLAGALALLPDRTGVLLDPKETVVSRREQLIAALNAAVPLDERSTRFAVSTGHGQDLAAYRAAGFATWRTIGDAASLRAFFGEGDTSERGVSIRHSLLDRATVERLHGTVPTVVAWTVNEIGRAADLVGWGVDGITTDRPEVARSVTASPGVAG